MFKNNRMQYIIKTCSSENVQELQNLLNEMSMNGWELYSMNEIETDDGFKYNCIFMSELKNTDESDSSDIINISSFKSQMEKMLSPQMNPYEICVDIQAKIISQQKRIAKIKTELDSEAPASVGRKKLNDKISAGLKELEELKHQLTKATSPDVMYSRLHEDKLTINLSEELLDYVSPEKVLPQEDLVAATVKTRLKLTDELGYVIPKIIFKDDESLNPCEFSIKIRGLEVYRGYAYPGYSMFFADELHLDKKPKNSITDIDLISGKKIIWLENSRTKDYWEKGLSGAEYISRLLEFLTVKYVEDLLDYADVDKYINIVEESNPFLFENIVPDFVSPSDLKFILTGLIKERVSIKNIVYIFEKLNDYADDCPKSDLLKKLRLALSRQIVKQHVNQDGIISVFEVSDKTIDELIPSFDEDEDFIVKVDGEFAEKLANKIAKKAVQHNINSPKLLVPLEYRHLLFTLLSNYLNDITVLSREEIGCNYQIEIIANI